MRWPRAAAAAVAVGIVCFSGSARAQETPADGRIVSVKLFKNGLAVVTRTVALRRPGTYRIDDAPAPVHGTFWVESSAKIESRVVLREVEEPVRGGAGINFQEALVGRHVTIHFRDGGIPAVNGTVERIAPAAGEEAWSRTYRQPQYYWNYGRWNQPPPRGRFLVVRTDTATTYVDSSMIAYLHAEGRGKTIRRRRPVLLLTVEKPGAAPAAARITYLTKGVSWAPSYRVDISDPATLAIEQKAVIKNELADIDRAEVHLISGFPSVKFAHVTSPLSTRTTWAQFFQELGQRFRPGQGAQGQMTQQLVVMQNAPAGPAGLDISAIPTGEGVDLHYQPIGRRSLAEGESLAVGIAEAKAPYERIVEWIVPDTRKPDGRHVQEHERRRNPEKYRDAAWDAVRFRNPFAFPMTTAAAMIVSGEEFNGQCMSYWVNAGEQTVLHVTKALSVRTRAVEHELEGKRKIVYIGGRTFRKTQVEGELFASNHRKEKIDLVIRRRFSGDLVSAEGDPKCVLREEGAYSVNKRNELTWTLELAPGGERRLTYRYSVLVYH